MLKLFNTLSRKKEEFAPREPDRVSLYTCGPSVYNYSHIGNFRTYVFWDVLKRYLKYKRYRVRHVMNITDVEDKTVRMARKEGKELQEFVKPKIARFLLDMAALNIQRPQVVAPVSKNIPAIISLISKLVAKKYAYVASDGVYFRVRKFRGYGKLGEIRRNAIKEGRNRFDDYDRRYVRDFCLWKFSDKEPNWKSPWGRGRPGWHIECSAIAMKYLGERMDLHCGGTDNIFPHHENEIAQSEAASGKMPFAKYWLHARHLTIRKRKMSKRTGNVAYVHELILEGYTPNCLRFFLLSRGYRSKLDYNEKTLGEGMGFCRAFGKCVKKLKEIRGSGKGNGIGKGMVLRILAIAIGRFERAIESDLNTRRALLAALEVANECGRLSHKMSSKEAGIALGGLRKMGFVLGLKWD